MKEYYMDKKTLLIVEDDEINRQLLEEILKEKYYILSAANGQDALDILKEKCQYISAVLLDIQMPVMDGFEFLEQVGQDSVYSKIPVIVTTVLDSVDDEKRCLELGATDFIVKPYNPLIVPLRVENIIHLRECDGIISDLEMDALTGFKTRKAYYNDIELFENDTEKSMQSVGVVFADINGLKHINDSFGHKAGDELIATIAKNVTAVFPKAKKYRLGGDEFVILSFDESKDEFESKLKRLAERWKGDYSAAVGSIWLENAKNFEKNVATADRRMYEDKSRYYESKLNESRRSNIVDTQDVLKTIETVAEHLPGGFFVYCADSEEKVITYNRELLKIFGCKNNQEFVELTGNSFKGMVHPDDLNIVESDISSQISDGNDIDRVKYRIICKDGTEKTVLDYGRFVHTDIYGDVYYVFLNDITEE